MPFPTERKQQNRRGGGRGNYPQPDNPQYGGMPAWNPAWNPAAFSNISMMGMPIPMPSYQQITGDYTTGAPQGPQFDPITGEARPLGGVVPGFEFQKKGGPQGPELNPIQIALAQLDQLLNQGSVMPDAPSEQDLNAALNEAASGINQQYGAQIGAIKHQNQGARGDVREGSAAIQKLYAGLDKSYEQAGRAERRQSGKLSNRLQNIGERGAQGVTSQANEMNNASMKGAAALGLADLGADLTKQTNQTAQQLGNRSIARGTSAASAVSKMGGNNSTFMNTSGQAARLEGTNRSADLYAQLQDYLQQNRDQIAALAGERAAALAQAKAGIQSSYMGSQADYADMAMQQQQSLFDNKVKLLELALAAQQAQEEGTGGAEGEDALEEFYSMLPEQIGGPSRILSEMHDPTISKLYEQLSGRPSMQNGYTGNRELGTDQPLVDNYANMQDWVGDALGQDVYAGLSTAQRNALVAALLSQLQGFGS